MQSRVENRVTIKNLKKNYMTSNILRAMDGHRHEIITNRTSLVQVEGIEK